MTAVSRLALSALVLALLLSPVGAVHPLAVHLYVTGVTRTLSESTELSVVTVVFLALTSSLPALFMTAMFVRALRARRYLSVLAHGSELRTFAGIEYRQLQCQEVLVFTAGLRRPTIYVSHGAEQRLAPKTLRAALLHEDAHRQRRDVLWRFMLTAVAEGLPFVPPAKRIVEQELLRAECSADDHAMHAGARRLDLFDSITAASRSSSGPLWVGIGGTTAEVRLVRLAHPETEIPGEATKGLAYLTAAACLPAIAAHVVAIAAACGPSLLL